MLLLNGKEFVPTCVEADPSESDRNRVFKLSETGETFVEQRDYVERRDQLEKPIWGCFETGVINVPYTEALIQERHYQESRSKLADAVKRCCLAMMMGYNSANTKYFTLKENAVFCLQELLLNRFCIGEVVEIFDPDGPEGNNTLVGKGIIMAPADHAEGSAETIAFSDFEFTEEGLPPFISSSKYVGYYRGFVFKNDVYGTGYYRDTQHLVSFNNHSQRDYRHLHKSKPSVGQRIQAEFTGDDPPWVDGIITNVRAEGTKLDISYFDGDYGDADFPERGMNLKERINFDKQFEVKVANQCSSLNESYDESSWQIKGTLADLGKEFHTPACEWSVGDFCLAPLMISGSFRYKRGKIDSFVLSDVQSEGQTCTVLFEPRHLYGTKAKFSKKMPRIETVPIHLLRPLYNFPPAPRSYHVKWILETSDDGKLDLPTSRGLEVLMVRDIQRLFVVRRAHLVSFVNTQLKELDLLGTARLAVSSDLVTYYNLPESLNLRICHFECASILLNKVGSGSDNGGALFKMKGGNTDMLESNGSEHRFKSHSNIIGQGDLVLEPFDSGPATGPASVRRSEMFSQALGGMQHNAGRGAKAAHPQLNHRHVREEVRSIVAFNKKRREEQMQNFHRRQLHLIKRQVTAENKEIINRLNRQKMIKQQKIEQAQMKAMLETQRRQQLILEAERQNLEEQRKAQQIAQLFKRRKEYKRPKFDLALDFSEPLPSPKLVPSRLRGQAFSDLVAVYQFTKLAQKGKVVDFEGASSFSLDELEAAFISRSAVALAGRWVVNLLWYIFDSFPEWIETCRARFLGMKLEQFDLESYSVSEILKLTVLSQGYAGIASKSFYGGTLFFELKAEEKLDIANFLIVLAMDIPKFKHFVDDTDEAVKVQESIWHDYFNEFADKRAALVEKKSNQTEYDNSKEIAELDAERKEFKFKYLRELMEIYKRLRVFKYGRDRHYRSVCVFPGLHGIYLQPPPSRELEASCFVGKFKASLNRSTPYPIMPDNATELANEAISSDVFAEYGVNHIDGDKIANPDSNVQLNPSKNSKEDDSVPVEKNHNAISDSTAKVQGFNSDDAPVYDDIMNQEMDTPKVSMRVRTLDDVTNTWDYGTISAVTQREDLQKPAQYRLDIHFDDGDGGYADYPEDNFVQLIHPKLGDGSWYYFDNIEDLKCYVDALNKRGCREGHLKKSISNSWPSVEKAFTEPPTFTYSKGAALQKTASDDVRSKIKIMLEKLFSRLREHRIFKFNNQDHERWIRSLDDVEDVDDLKRLIFELENAIPNAFFKAAPFNVVEIESITKFVIGKRMHKGNARFSDNLSNERFGADPKEGRYCEVQDQEGVWWKGYISKLWAGRKGRKLCVAHADFPHFENGLRYYNTRTPFQVVLSDLRSTWATAGGDKIKIYSKSVPRAPRSCWELELANANNFAQIKICTQVLCNSIVSQKSQIESAREIAKSQGDTHEPWSKLDVQPALKMIVHAKFEGEGWMYGSIEDLNPENGKVYVKYETEETGWADYPDNDFYVHVPSMKMKAGVQEGSKRWMDMAVPPYLRQLVQLHTIRKGGKKREVHEYEYGVIAELDEEMGTVFVSPFNKWFHLPSEHIHMCPDTFFPPPASEEVPVTEEVHKDSPVKRKRRKVNYEESEESDVS